MLWGHYELPSISSEHYKALRIGNILHFLSQELVKYSMQKIFWHQN